MALTVYNLSEGERRAIEARHVELIRVMMLIAEIQGLQPPVTLSPDRMRLICGVPDPPLGVNP